MKIKSERDKRNYLIIALCAILVIMGVGYASFSSLLTINGTANITNSWCVGFDNTKTNTFEVTKGVSSGTTPTGTMTYSGTACGSTLQPNSSLTATFHQPGDQIEYTLTIKNKSSVTAAIKSIIINNSDNVTSKWTRTVGNITYTVNMPLDTTLSPNEETTMTVVAKFQNDTSIDSGYTGESQSITVGINTEQDDGNGGFTPTPATTPLNGSIYRWSTTTANNGDSISNIGNYTTDASTLNKTIYLKHDVTNDIITDSYVCFVYNNAEHCMKGAAPDEYLTNQQILEEYQMFYNLPSDVEDPVSVYGVGCEYSLYASYCEGGEFKRVHVEDSNESYETVGVIGSSYESCHVSGDGSSSCD